MLYHMAIKMKIQEVEKILNIPRANIRFYEKEGLISPKREKTATANTAKKIFYSLNELWFSEKSE